MDQVDVIVIGAGAVGLAVARAMALAGREVIVLEAEDAIGTQVSSRNSEVIHAGLYYEPGSLRARLCVEGKKLLYAYCKAHHVDAKACGKLIVATAKDELEVLDQLMVKGATNGVDDLELIDGTAAAALEPQVTCLAAIVSPSSGIFDSHGYMLAMQGEIEGAGGAIAFGSPVEHIRADQGRLTLRVGGEQPSDISAACVINAAGLGAIPLACNIEGLDPKFVPEPHYARGNYFTISGRAPFERLIYPVPQNAGLGIHYTRDLGGQARFGPDVEWIDEIDYEVNVARAESFYASIRTYWPALEDGALQPAYTGIRPKIQEPGGPMPDFMIQDQRIHSIPGLINLFGIESPGLTSSLAIGEYVAELASV